MKLHYNISKFWTRVGAHIIDILIIGIFGLLIGLLLEDLFVSIGKQGLLFGLFVTVLYFSIGNSKITGGQTIGKAFVNIKTINANEDSLSFPYSLLRAIILFLPFFLLNYPLPFVDELSSLNSYKSTLCVCMLIGIPILYVTHKSTRQSLHDLVINTYVVNTEEYEEGTPLKPNSQVGLYLFLGIVVILVGFTTFNLVNQDSTDTSDEMRTALENIDGVIRAGYKRHTTTFYGDEEQVIEQYTLLLYVQEISEDEIEMEQSEIVRNALKILFKLRSDAVEVDNINIQLNREFDIGIASKSQSHSFSKSPEKWATSIK